MKKRRIASALLSGTMLMSMCCFGASAAESKTDVIIFGDLNLDGSVNLLDAIASQKYIAKTLSLDEVKAVDESLLDINKDGAINLLDAIALQKHLVASEVKDYIGKGVYKWVPAVTKTENIWVPAKTETKVIHHEAVTHEEPVYEYKTRSICNTCGADITGNTSPHMKQHWLNGENMSHHSETIKVQTGTQTVIDQEAWDETVTETVEGHYETKTVVVTEGHWEQY